LGSAEVHSEKKRSRHKTADVFYAVVGVVTNNSCVDVKVLVGDNTNKGGGRGEEGIKRRSKDNYAVVGVVTNNTWFDECSC
jgi:hypothetical protein